jgi:hypothetical protein
LLDDYLPIYNKLGENAILSLLGDAVRWKAKDSGDAQLDLALLLNQYDYTHFKLDKGPFSKRQIQDLTTYDNRVHKAWLTGEQIEEILDWGTDLWKNGNSVSDNLYTKKGITGLVQVSGLKYSISPDGVKDVILRSKKNQGTRFDPNQKYYVAYDDYVLRRAKSDHKDSIVKILEQNKIEDKRYNFNLEEAMLGYLRNAIKGNPFSIKPRGRIVVEKSQLQK